MLGPSPCFEGRAVKFSIVTLLYWELIHSGTNTISCSSRDSNCSS